MQTNSDGLYQQHIQTPYNPNFYVSSQNYNPSYEHQQQNTHLRGNSQPHFQSQMQQLYQQQTSYPFSNMPAPNVCNQLPNQMSSQILTNTNTNMAQGMPPFSCPTSITPVSYTHLDVYKRQQ